MSLFRLKKKKSKYQILPIESRQNNFKNDEIIACEGFSLEAVNVFINNFVNPQDASKSSRRRLSLRDEGRDRSWTDLNNRSRQSKNEKLQVGDYQKTTPMTPTERRNYATFMRLKRKLDNIKIFYPNVYYNKESIIELWARDNELYEINMDILEYDKDSPAWMWI